MFSLLCNEKLKLFCQNISQQWKRMLIEKKKNFQPLLTGEKNILSLALNQLESLIAIVKSAVYYCSLVMKCMRIEKNFTYFELWWNIFIATKQEFWVCYLNYPHWEGVSIPFCNVVNWLWRPTFRRQSSGWNCVFEQFLWSDFFMKYHLWWIVSMLWLYSHWSEVWNLYFTLIKSEILVLHWNTHICDFICLLFYTSDLTVARLWYLSERKEYFSPSELNSAFLKAAV